MTANTPITSLVCDQTTYQPYSPRPGDIIQKDRRRIEYRGDDRSAPLYRRSRFTGEWYHDRWLDISVGVLSIMVRCDGWRLVYRAEEAAR